MLRRFMRDKYCAENKIGAFNQAVLNDYSLWLETKLHESTSNNAEATALLLDSVSKQQYVEVLSKLEKAKELIIRAEKHHQGGHSEIGHALREFIESTK